MIVSAEQIRAVGDAPPRRWPGPAPRDDRYLTTIRAARIIGISAVSLNELARTGRIARIKDGATYKYRLADVLAYRERNDVSVTTNLRLQGSRP